MTDYRAIVETDYLYPELDRKTEGSKRRRAASALDRTHACGERGPRTLRARQQVAAALDGQRALLWSDVLWLERIANITHGGQP